jgi:hypothetical protein
LWGSLGLLFPTKKISTHFINNLPILSTPFSNMSAQLRQSTLSFHRSGRIDVNLPRPRLKASATLTAAASATLIFGGKRRRKVGGPNEAAAIEAFKSPHAHQAAGEPDSDDSDANESDGDHRPRPKWKRNAYSREKKLLAITYLEQTDMLGKIDGTFVPISLVLASKKLGVDRHCLREWKQQKQRNLQMKKGAKRWRGESTRREPEMEFQLHKEFAIAQGEGQIIFSRWFLVHAKAIYISQAPPSSHFAR